VKKNEGGATLRGAPSPRLHSSSPANAGDPVRRGFSAQSLLSLEYWVTRPSAQLRTRRVTTRKCVARSLFVKHTFAISRHELPEVCIFVRPSLRKEGAGKTGCALHPRSRVQLRKKNAHTSIQVQRRASGLPCAMILRRTSCSPRCANSFSHRHPRIDGWGLPGRAGTSSADLTPATGARTTRLGRTRHAQRQGSRRAWYPPAEVWRKAL
jgi:hypothetical protein